MSHRLVPSIYQVFMAAIDKVHIPPGLWRTFRDYAVTWRHRPAVVYGQSKVSVFRYPNIALNIEIRFVVILVNRTSPF